MAPWNSAHFRDMPRAYGGPRRRIRVHDRSHLAPLDNPSSGRASRVHLPPQGGKGFPLLPQPFLRQIRDGLVIVGRDEARAGVDVDRRKAVDDGLAEAEDRQVALLERLLIRRQLHPAGVERLDDLRAGVEADIDDLAGLLAGGFHVDRSVAEHLPAGIDDRLGRRIGLQSRGYDGNGEVWIGRPFRLAVETDDLDAAFLERFGGPFLARVAD